MTGKDLAVQNAVPPALRQAGFDFTNVDGYRVLTIPAKYRESCNLLLPVEEITQTDPLWTPNVRVAKLDLERHTYPGQNSGERALSKHGLLLLAQLAGVDVVGTTRMPTAVLRPNEIGWQATVRIRKSDGTTAEMVESRVMDVDIEREAIDHQIATGRNTKDKSPAEQAAMAKSRWLKERPHFDAKCETKALLRAIRSVLQIPHAYKTDAVQRPFLVVGYSFTPDYDDAATRAALVAVATRSTQALYPASDALEAPAVDVAVEDDPGGDYAPAEGELRDDGAVFTDGAWNTEAGIVTTAFADFDDAPDDEPDAVPSAEAAAAASAADPGTVVLTFGKHAGVAVRDLPHVYVEWMAGKLAKDDVKPAAARGQYEAAAAYLAASS